MSIPLLTSQDVTGHVHLIIGSNPLANSRCTRSLEAGAKIIVVSHHVGTVHYALQQKVDEGRVELHSRAFQDDDLTTLGREAVDNVVDAVFITLRDKSTINAHISTLCRRLRIPVNVVDAPNLCTFTLLSTHSDGPLHIGITTSGKGCKLASRIRREVKGLLPPHFGDAINRLGDMRRRIWEEDHRQHDLADLGPDQSDDDAPAQKASFNQLVQETDHHAAKDRRMRWLAQICEYWSLRRLAAITDADVNAILESYSAVSHSTDLSRTGDIALGALSSKPRIILAGSGPGSPHLLTIATHRAIQTASIILADKLVPDGVLDLIPRRTPVHIARKFPGNADAAQQELLELGLDALQKGMTVVRLKQGDPYIYGRGGEEYDFFRKHGYVPIVLPGITSSLSAPMFAGIPATHRSVADQVLVCTGTGRKGAAPTPPPYVKTQTVVFLMALHRLSALIESLTGAKVIGSSADITVSTAPWPTTTPCAVIERASCPDQRVIRTTLEHVVSAVEEEGSRPPGLLVVGSSCEVLMNTGGHKWVVEEGFRGFDDLMDEPLELWGNLLGNRQED